jgi:hypothetical protein
MDIAKELAQERVTTVAEVLAQYLSELFESASAVRWQPQSRFATGQREIGRSIERLESRSGFHSFA